MTRIRRALACLTCFAVVPFALTSAPVASAAAGNPSIRITNLKDGDVVTGNSVTVRVSVANFKLVPPIYVHPPKLTGNQGHIHYVLDSLANFIPRRDATVALSHSWSGVAPGKHTVEAYLATSQHAQFANAQPVKVTITVKAAGSSPPAQQQKQPGVWSAPHSGGGAMEPRSSFPPQLPILGMLAILLGVLLLAGPAVRRRMDRRLR